MSFCTIKVTSAMKDERKRLRHWFGPLIACTLHKRISFCTIEFKNAMKENACATGLARNHSWATHTIHAAHANTFLYNQIQKRYERKRMRHWLGSKPRVGHPYHARCTNAYLSVQSNSRAL